MDITIPEADARFFVLPPVPAATSPALLDATRRYVEIGGGDGSDECAARWGDTANEIADFKPASLTDVAVKLLFVLHYLEPEYPNGQPAIDLSRFDVDAGRKLLRCAADVAAFGNGKLAGAGDDAEMLAHFEGRQRCYAQMIANGPYFLSETHSPAIATEHDAHEVPIVNATAETVRGAIAQAWVAWEALHDNDDDEDRVVTALIHAADFDALVQRERDRRLEWDDMAMLAVVRSLRVLAGEA